SAEPAQKMRFTAPRFTVNQEPRRMAALTHGFDAAQTFFENAAVNRWDVDTRVLPRAGHDCFSKWIHACSPFISTNSSARILSQRHSNIVRARAVRHQLVALGRAEAGGEIVSMQ